nr:uncharacterized protein LOC112941556 [Solanum lycopersicum]
MGRPPNRPREFSIVKSYVTIGFVLAGVSGVASSCPSELGGARSGQFPPVGTGSLRGFDSRARNSLVFVRWRRRRNGRVKAGSGLFQFHRKVKKIGGDRKGEGALMA